MSASWQAREWLKTGGVLTVCAFASLTFWRTSELVRDADVSVRLSDGIQQKMRVTLDNVDRTVIVMGVTATHLEKAGRQWETTQRQLASDSGDAITQTKATLATIQTAASNLDVSANGLLTTVNQSVTQQNQSLLETQRDAQNLLTEADFTIKGLTSTTEQSAEAMGHLNGMAKDGQEIADHFRDEILKPVAVWKKIAEFVLGHGYQARAFVP